MAILSRTVLYRAASLCAFLGAVCSGFYGAWLLATIDWEHGSTAGNILIGGFGILLLLVAPVLFTFGVIAWPTSKSI